MQVKLRKHTIGKQILENKQIVTREYYSDANQYIPASAGLDYSIIALEDKQIIAHRDIDINVYKETLPIGIVNSFKAFFEHFGSERVASTLVKRGGKKRIIYRHGNLYSHDIAKNTVTVLASIVVADPSVFEIKLQEQQSKIIKERKSQIGTAERSEKIRTYNYPQNRVTDHRINFSIMELDRVMDGYLDPIIEALINEDMRLKLEGLK